MRGTEDAQQFSAMLTTLCAYYPSTKVDLSAVMDGYFEDLHVLTIEDVRMLFVLARRQCKFFPTPADLLEIARKTFTHFEGTSGERACASCPTGHGAHALHDVGHYHAGPYCRTCNATLPVPQGYTHTRPVGSTPALRDLARPIDLDDEVNHAFIQPERRFEERARRLKTLPAAIEPAEEDAERLESRRQFLQHQAREIREAVREGMNEALREQNRPSIEE